KPLFRRGMRFPGERLSARWKQLLNFFGGQMFGLLAFLGEDMNFNKREFGQSHDDVFAAGATGLVLVEHDKDSAFGVNVSANQFFLSRGEGAAHEGNDALHAVLPKFHAIEVSFDEHKRALRRLLDGSVEVEKF